MNTKCTEMVAVEGATYVQVTIAGETEYCIRSDDIEDYDDVRVEIHDERDVLEDGSE